MITFALAAMCCLGAQAHRRNSSIVPVFNHPSSTRTEP